MRPDRTLRHFIENFAPPVIAPNAPARDPFEIHQFEQPVIIMPAPGSAPLRTDPQFPGEGMPARAQDRAAALSAGWARLARGGQALGKSENFRYDADVDRIQKGIEVLRVEGSDLDACQLCVTLGQPAIALESLDGIDERAQLIGAQDIQGFQSNDDLDPTTNFPGTSTPPAWAPITAWVQWGVGGFQSQAFVDWIQGAGITVTGSYVSVTPVALPDAINRPGQSALYRVGANIGPGAPGGIARRTVFIGQVADGAQSTAYPVPPFAHRATVLGFNDLAVPIISVGFLRFWQRATPARGVGDSLFNANQPTSFDVPNAATYFTVVNGSGAAMGFAVIFELSI